MQLTSRKMPLDSCKQVHDECALLPYAINTFAFDDKADLSDFVAYVLKAQLKAIESISIAGNITISIPASIVTKLPGLKHLTAFVELNYYHEDCDKVLDASTEFDKARESWMGGVLKFERLALQKVSLCLCWGEHDKRDLPFKGKWSRRVVTWTAPSRTKDVVEMVERRMIKKSKGSSGK
jgi:hypothetical protein